MPFIYEENIPYKGSRVAFPVSLPISETTNSSVSRSMLNASPLRGIEQ